MGTLTQTLSVCSSWLDNPFKREWNPDYTIVIQHVPRSFVRLSLPYKAKLYNRQVAQRTTGLTLFGCCSQSIHSLHYPHLLILLGLCFSLSIVGGAPRLSGTAFFQFLLFWKQLPFSVAIHPMRVSFPRTRSKIYIVVSTFNRSVVVARAYYLSP